MAEEITKNCDYNNIKAMGRVATADSFVVKAVNNVRGKPQTFMTAITTLA